MDSDKLLVVCTNSAGDRKLYGILRRGNGQVWDWKHEKFVDFVDKNIFTYTIHYQYKGGDIYVMDAPGLPARAIACVLVYIQSSRKPSIYDQLYLVVGEAKMPNDINDIPDKIRPLTPMVKDPVSRQRSKVKQDAYSGKRASEW